MNVAEGQTFVLVDVVVDAEQFLAPIVGKVVVLARKLARARNIRGRNRDQRKKSRAGRITGT